MSRSHQSVPALLLVVGILGCGPKQPAQVFVPNPEQQAISEIRQLGGEADATYASFPPQATDADLVHLKDLTKLQRLFLTGTEVTDAGLVHLKDLTKLQVLYLYNTQVTDAGVNDLKEAMPGVVIFR